MWHLPVLPHLCCLGELEEKAVKREEKNQDQNNREKKQRRKQKNKRLMQRERVQITSAINSTSFSLGSEFVYAVFPIRGKKQFLF